MARAQVKKYSGSVRTSNITDAEIKRFADTRARWLNPDGCEGTPKKRKRTQGPVEVDEEEEGDESVVLTEREKRNDARARKEMEHDPDADVDDGLLGDNGNDDGDLLSELD